MVVIMQRDYLIKELLLRYSLIPAQNITYCIGKIISKSFEKLHEVSHYLDSIFIPTPLCEILMYSNLFENIELFQILPTNIATDMLCSAYKDKNQEKIRILSNVLYYDIMRITNLTDRRYHICQFLNQLLAVETNTDERKLIQSLISLLNRITILVNVSDLTMWILFFIVSRMIYVNRYCIKPTRFVRKISPPSCKTRNYHQIRKYSDLCKTQFTKKTICLVRDTMTRLRFLKKTLKIIDFTDNGKVVFKKPYNGLYFKNQTIKCRITKLRYKSLFKLYIQCFLQYQEKNKQSWDLYRISFEHFIGMVEQKPTRILYQKPIHPNTINVTEIITPTGLINRQFKSYQNYEMYKQNYNLFIRLKDALILKTTFCDKMQSISYKIPGLNLDVYADIKSTLYLGVNIPNKFPRFNDCYIINDKSQNLFSVIKNKKAINSILTDDQIKNIFSHEINRIYLEIAGDPKYIQITQCGGIFDTNIGNKHDVPNTVCNFTTMGESPLSQIWNNLNISNHNTTYLEQHFMKYKMFYIRLLVDRRLTEHKLFKSLIN